MKIIAVRGDDAESEALANVMYRSKGWLWVDVEDTAKRFLRDVFGWSAERLWTKAPELGLSQDMSLPRPKHEWRPCDEMHAHGDRCIEPMYLTPKGALCSLMHWGREQCPTMWIKYILDNAKPKMMHTPLQGFTTGAHSWNGVIITGLRIGGEWDYVRANHGLVVVLDDSNPDTKDLRLYGKTAEENAEILASFLQEGSLQDARMCCYHCSAVLDNSASVGYTYGHRVLRCTQCGAANKDLK